MARSVLGLSALDSPSLGRRLAAENMRNQFAGIASELTGDKINDHELAQHNAARLVRTAEREAMSIGQSTEPSAEECLRRAGQIMAENGLPDERI